MNIHDAGKDTVITFGTRPAESSQILQGLISPAAPASALHSGTPSTIGNPDRSVDGKKFEVIKSIVYGGLAESITSLSVVSSAAGGGAATCKQAIQFTLSIHTDVKKNFLMFCSSVICSEYFSYRDGQSHWRTFRHLS